MAQESLNIRTTSASCRELVLPHNDGKQGSHGVLPQKPKHFPFMNLPPELRNLVFKHHFTMPGPVTLRPLPSRAQGAAIKATRSYRNSKLALLLVSRSIYKDAAGIFYQLNNFRFNNICDLRTCLMSIGTRRRNCITTLSFHWWGSRASETFKVLRSCKRLTKLCIFVDYKTQKGARLEKFAGHLVQPLTVACGIKELLKVRGLQVLGVVVNGFLEPSVQGLWVKLISALMVSADDGTSAAQAVEAGFDTVGKTVGYRRSLLATRKRSLVLKNMVDKQAELEELHAWL
ncbi:MAG: hypothetical protein M1827_003045 [Pycnora praestabilis]|nr:MAG: hypothetical protein M1827_003045 [Pycnora praestabilis]